MLKIENTEVMGWRAAIRGMRNPKNSWDRSDSKFYVAFNTDTTDNDRVVAELGPNDLDLCKRLINGGAEHRKFLRMIHVQADIVGPYYWVQEFDTYKIGTCRNSCSFMHKGTVAEYTMDDFTWDQDEELDNNMYRESLLVALNSLREKYNETKDMRYFRRIRQMLPAGWNIRFTWDASYETLMNIWRQRRHHRLKEWHEFCDWIETLPYMREFLGLDKKADE